MAYSTTWDLRAVTEMFDAKSHITNKLARHRITNQQRSVVSGLATGISSQGSCIQYRSQWDIID